MKVIIYIVLLLFFIYGCKKDPASINTLSEPTAITTDKNIYSTTDSIRISIFNTSGSEIELGYRCSYDNLEMYFQKKENGRWSQNQWFEYMSFKCPTLIRSFDRNRSIRHSISANEFQTTGIFRVLLPCYFPGKDSSVVAISNAFEIK